MIYVREREHKVGRVKDALLRAAAALTEPATKDVLAFALLETGLALMWIAELDDDFDALLLVEQRLLAAKRQRETP